MPFKAASPNLLKVAKVGDKVRFTLHPAGMASTMTSITVQPRTDARAPAHKVHAMPAVENPVSGNVRHAEHARSRR